MSRFLDAFLAGDGKARISGCPVPNKSEKAKTPHACPADTGFPPYSPFSGQRTRKFAFSDEAFDSIRLAAILADTAPPVAAAIPAAAPELLRHLRDDLHCKVTLEADRVMIRPTHRCRPAVVAAALAVVSDLAAMLAAEAADPNAGREPATDAEVQTLAAALAARPGHAITDKAAAAQYFMAEARRRLSATDDPMVRLLLPGRDERDAIGGGPDGRAEPVTADRDLLDRRHDGGQAGGGVARCSVQ